MKIVIYIYNGITMLDAIGPYEVLRNMKALNWINKIDKTIKWTTSVCYGSLILAATGLLNGKDATSHWKPIDLLKDFGVTPKNERIVKQGNYISAAGVSAGIDMALYLSNEIVGETETKAIQLVIEYDPNPIYDCGNISKATNEVIKMAEIKLANDAKKEIGLMDILKSGKTLIKTKKAVNRELS